MKDKIAKWYNLGLWTLDMVRAAVVKGVISDSDFTEITGENP